MNTQVGKIVRDVVVVDILDVNMYLFLCVFVCVASMSMSVIAVGGGHEGHPVRSLILWVCCDILHFYIYITPPSYTHMQAYCI